MSARDLVEGEAMLDDEENEEELADDYDGEGEAHQGVRTANHYDSSEEDDDDDDDEEAARAVREGFIVDEDEELEDRAERRREKRKRRREEREREDEHLDEEDLELIGELNPSLQAPVAAESKFKRLKRGHKDRDLRQPSQGIDDIFNSDEEEEAAGDYGRHGHRRHMHDEMDDFIEEDVFSDEELQREREDLEIARPAKKGMTGLGATDAAGLDENALEDMRAAFGDGNEYLFALEMEDQEEEQEEDEEKHLDLKDVFEPSQLAEKMLTEEDNQIRLLDEPERHQIARKPYRNVVLTEEQFREEAAWISNLMLLKKRIEPELREPFQRSVAKVLEFLVTDDWEVPFIFQHRKDYMIHAVKAPVEGAGEDGDASQYTVRAEKLLNMTDLWDIFDHDLKFKALVEKRNTIQKTYDNVQSLFNVSDSVVEEMLPAAVTMEELQDVQDYIHFQYASQLRDMTLMNSDANGETHRRKASSKTFFERVRNGKAYGLVRAFGITADAFAQNALKEGRRQYTEDPAERPEEMADGFVDNDFSNASHVIKAAKSLFAEEIVMSPKMRKVIRQAYYMNGAVDCFRTEKGLRRIDEQHPYYEFKYLRNQQLSDIARRPELYLRMLKAEEEGLVEVKVRFENFDQFRQRLYPDIESDNYSEIADGWNRSRRDVLDMALGKLERLINRSVKENIRQECENHVAKECRETFSQRLDQAPYKPKGMVLGTVPRVLALSTGSGVVGREPIHWAYIEEDGRVLENGKFVDLSIGDRDRNIPDGKDVDAFVELVDRRRPDVIGVSGMSPETRRLYKLLAEVVDKKDLRGAPYTDDHDEEISDRLEVIIVNDEVARLYQHSERAKKDHPSFAPLTHYCVALAKYLQSPLKEYASLGRDIVSIQFKPGQQLVTQELLLKQLETALVDMVNLVGVDINEAVTDSSTANLLPYVCGLGPRKAAHLLKIVNMNGGVVNNRVELLGVNAQYPAMGVKVWNNCASFLYIDFENVDPDADPLDNTRVHPEDYDIARKMAADALELDEEDIKAETDENGTGAIVRKLFREEAQDRVNDLILEEYAEQLEKNLNQRKRATLETIRAELQQPYEELRKQYVFLSTDDIFTMLTGETSDTLAEGMVVPISIKRVSDDHIDGKLDCGIDALVPESELTDRYDIPVRALYSPHQTVSAKILFLNRKNFTCNVSLREEQVSRPVSNTQDRLRGEWDERQEQQDRESLQEKTQSGGRTMRVIKHPLFRPFNSTQAEEFLGSQSRGDVVIRPSSKGHDHLAVTWKVADGIFQHIDVLELDKENEFSVGRTLKVGGRYTYSDLDDLIFNHVKAMAKKVDEMMLHEKYQDGTKDATSMAAMEELEIHSKSYFVRWVNVKPGHTISWSIQPHRKSLNFGIFKHPGHSAVLGSNNLPPADSHSTDSIENLPATALNANSRQFASTPIIERLTGIGLKQIQWIGKCEADKIVKGTYDVPANEGGNYALVFDNTFSKQISKTVTLVLLTYQQPCPHSRHQYHTQSYRLVLPPSINTDPASIHTGILQKRRRKRHQGWARRFFSLDFTSSTLSYYHDPNSSALRGSIPLTLAAVACNENSREISIDSGTEVWHLRASNDQEFISWKRALERASSSKTPAAEESHPSPLLRVPSQRVLTNAAEAREWAQVESLVGKISGSRDAVRRPHPEANGDESMEAREKRSFWKRKASGSSQLGGVKRATMTPSSTQLVVPGPSSGDTASLSGDRKPSSITSHPDQMEEVHDHLMAVLRDLDSAVAEFSTLIAESKHRRHPPGLTTQSRLSMESDVSQEFFDAVDGGSSSPLLKIKGDSDDEGTDDFSDATARQAEDKVVVDDAPSDSEDEVSETPTPQGDRYAPLFPAKPKSLTPLPLSKVPRRSNIPAPTVMPPSLIGFLRKNVGKDLSQISMPVSSNEPFSLLQRAAEVMEYSILLDHAASASDAVERLIYVTAYALSSLSCNRVKERSIRKPFNPMLGETYELVREDLGYRFIAEKVSHRPVQLAYQADGKDWSVAQSPMPTQKFWGKSAEIVTEGKMRLTLHTTGEHFSWSNATSFLRNIIAGEKYSEPVGEMSVVNETTGQKTVSAFKAGGMFSGRSEEVVTKALDSSGRELPLGLTGTWTTSLQMTKNGSATAPVWNAGPLVSNAPKHYGLTVFAATLNEITPIEDHKLPPTDSRLRPDQRALEDGDVDQAEEVKVKLEESQRARRREMESAGQTWNPRWFTRVDDDLAGIEGEVVWRLKSGKEGYWEERSKGNWTGVVPVFET
ncbi:transcription elongation factor spt6 [Aspergillus arachidicola]|uniref:Transcription elongation factor SPT6 n=1 Tax=Aspergillus arachidicola TaxID=656916 RepID=A0A2G7FI96_9EURO|nr:transcription elongation factor spt6 [Aspergillus arachidicola]